MSYSDTDDEIYSLPIEVERQPSESEWEEEEEEVFPQKKTKSWKWVVLIVTILVVAGTVTGGLLLGLDAKKNSYSLDQRLPNISGDAQDSNETSKLSKSSKLDRNIDGGDTIGGGDEAGSLSMSFPFSETNSFMSMSFPSLESNSFLSMSFPSLEGSTLDLNNSKSSKLSKSSKSGQGPAFGETIGGGEEAGSLSMTFLFRESNSLMSMSFPSLESNSFMSMSFPSLESSENKLAKLSKSSKSGHGSTNGVAIGGSEEEAGSLSMSFPSLESNSFMSMSFLNIDSNAIDVSDNFNSPQGEKGPKPTSIGSKGSKTGRGSSGGEIAGSLSMSTPITFRFLEYNAGVATGFVSPPLNIVDRQVFQQKNYV